MKSRDLNYYLSLVYLVTGFLFVVSSIWAAWALPGNVFEDFMERETIVYIGTMMIMLKYAYREAIHDGMKFYKSEKVQHGWSAFARCATMVVLFLGFNFTDVFGFWTGALIAVSVLFAFSLVFSMTYNRFTGRRLFYVGSTAVYDHVLGWYKWPIEVVMVAAGIYLL